MSTRTRPISVLAAAVAVLSVLAGCSRAGGDTGRPPSRSRPGTRGRTAAGLLPQRHPRVRADRAGEGPVRQGAGRHEARTDEVQRRADEINACSATRWTSGFIGSGPADQRLRQVQGRELIRLVVRRHVGRRATRRGTGHHRTRGPGRQDDRHPAAGQHPGRVAEEVAQGQEHHRATCSTSRTPRRSTSSSRARCRRRGCPSRGRSRLVLDARRAGAARREDAVAGRASSRPRCSSSAPQYLQRAPANRQGAAARPARARTTSRRPTRPAPRPR